MPKIGTFQGYTIYWTAPATDGGHGSGEVMVGADSVGTAQTEAQALRMAQEHIRRYLAKMGR